MVVSPSVLRSLMRGEDDNNRKIHSRFTTGHCYNDSRATATIPTSTTVATNTVPSIFGTTTNNNNNNNDYNFSYQILACSMNSMLTSDFRLDQFEMATLDGRELCSDRRSFLSHLYPTALSASTGKILFQQGSLIMVRFATDQLEIQMAKDDLVSADKLTQEDADEECEEWSKREWRIRWTAFPERFTMALVKFHAATLLMRFYEYIAAAYVDSFTLDRLTQDTFKSAKRVATTNPKPEYMRKSMFWTCLWANGIAYLADWSVHIVLLTSSVAYRYYWRRQLRRERMRRLEAEGAIVKRQDGDNDDDDKEDNFGPMFMMLMYKSTLLTLSRVTSWVATSAGGAIGSTWYPGWGTLVGGNFADGLASNFFDEMLA